MSNQITVAWQERKPLRLGYKCTLDVPAGPINSRIIRALMRKRNGCPFVTEFSWLREGSGKVHSCKQVIHKDDAAQGWDCKDG